MQTTLKQTEYSNTQSSAKLYGIIAEDMDPIWDIVSEHIKSALQYSDGKYNLEDIKEKLEEQKMQLFIVVEKEIVASVITEIVNYPQKRVLTIFLLGGKKMDEWLHLLDQLERWGVDEGCDQIELYGRPGWERVLGWDKTYVALKKGLNEVKH